MAVESPGSPVNWNRQWRPPRQEPIPSGLAREDMRHYRRAADARGPEVAQGGSYRLLTPAEVAEWLRVSEATIKNKYKAWGLKPQKVGRLLRFRERDVVVYLESRYG